MNNQSTIQLNAPVIEAPPSQKALDSLFIAVCRRQKASRTPVWLMRQAGRFMPEYRAIRSRLSFLELCKNSDLTAEVTCMAVEKLQTDAAIIFQDILLPLETMGVGLRYSNEGPLVSCRISSFEDVSNLEVTDLADSLHFVLDAIKKTRRELPPGVPLIGFAGAPFTLASYLIEGGASRNFVNVKTLMYRDKTTWHSLMDLLACQTTKFLNLQIDAGAQAVQLFDSWIGCLSPSDYEEFVLPHMRNTISGISKTVPIIHFGTGTSGLLELMAMAGGDVIGVDWRVDLNNAWSRIGYDWAIQGNLDPVVLFGDKKEIRMQVQRVLDQAGGHPGHIFNLGHGVLPETPFDNVRYLIETVRELSTKSV
jgi:uroporphyrinogen decarboxylase